MSIVLSVVVLGLSYTLSATEAMPCPGSQTADAGFPSALFDAAGPSLVPLGYQCGSVSPQGDITTSLTIAAPGLNWVGVLLLVSGVGLLVAAALTRGQPRLTKQMPA